MSHNYPPTVPPPTHHGTQPPPPIHGTGTALTGAPVDVPLWAIAALVLAVAGVAIRATARRFARA